MNLLRILAMAAAGVLSSEGVERDADGTPVAFRMWKAGANVTDHGTHYFTKKSAELLLAEQAARGNLYSFDVDHLSLNSIAPPESRKAVGWFQIETRDSPSGPELWVTSAEFTDAVRAGLTKSPPEWRYFSPAYDTKKDSGEIVSLLNCAITNNPATWSVTALASSTTSAKDPLMNLAALLAAMMGDDEEKKKEARAAIKAIADDDENAGSKKAAEILAVFGEPDGDEDPEKKKEEETKKAAAAAAAKTAAETPPEKKPEDEATKAARAARIKAEGTALAELGVQDRRIAKLEGVQDREERARILATRSDLTPSQLKVLATKPTEDLEGLLELIPKPAVDPAAAARVTATRAGGAGSDAGAVGSHRASRLAPKEREELRMRMGGDAVSKGVHWDPEHPNDLVFSTMTRAEARAVLAERAKTGRDSAQPQNPANAGGGSR